jgi:molecular chaperone DnaK
MEYTLTRAQFNELTHHLVEATTGPVRQAMADAGVGNHDLSKVLLVGGSSRIPAVQELVRSLTGREGFKGINPDECVALGACLQGGVLSGSVTGLLLLDVTPLSLGIETVGGVATRIIERNTTLPISRSQIFTTAANFQTSVEIHVLQGERPMAKQNKTLGKFKLTGIKRALRGVPQIEVTFTIDANGIVNVSAKDLGTGKQQDITITASSNMSEAEIQQAIRDAQTYASEDQAQRDEMDARNQAEAALYQAASVQKSLSREDKAAVKSAVKEVQRAMKGKDTAVLLSATDQLKTLLASTGNPV